MTEETETQDTIEGTDRGVKSTLPVVKRLDNGYVIAQAAILTDGGTFLRNNDFYLINPSGRILIHDNDVETLEKFATDPVKIKDLEETGMV